MTESTNAELIRGAAAALLAQPALTFVLEKNIGPAVITTAGRCEPSRGVCSGTRTVTWSPAHATQAAELDDRLRQRLRPMSRWVTSESGEALYRYLPGRCDRVVDGETTTALTTAPGSTRHPDDPLLIIERLLTAESATTGPTAYHVTMPACPGDRVAPLDADVVLTADQLIESVTWKTLSPPPGRLRRMVTRGTTERVSTSWQLTLSEHHGAVT